MSYRTVNKLQASLNCSFSNFLDIVVIVNAFDMLISTKVADALLEKSTLGYIQERGDLIGLLSNGLLIDGKNPCIAGIVESNEPAVYLSSVALAKYYYSTDSSTLVNLGEDYGIVVAPGEAILAIKEAKEGEFCFVENQPLIGYEDKIEEIVVYGWNRVYPSDKQFDISLVNWKVVAEEAFAGYSHEKITKRIYRR